jgi:hypothetical protein
VLHDPSVATIPKGSWYFDLRKKELVYRPQRTRFLTFGSDGSDLIRFRVVVRLAGGGAGDQRVREISELDVRPVAPLNWSPEF